MTFSVPTLLVGLQTFKEILASFSALSAHFCFYNISDFVDFFNPMNPHFLCHLCIPLTLPCPSFSSQGTIPPSTPPHPPTPIHIPLLRNLPMFPAGSQSTRPPPPPRPYFYPIVQQLPDHIKKLPPFRIFPQYYGFGGCWVDCKAHLWLIINNKPKSL